MKDYIAVFDIGTSAIKGTLVNKNAHISGEYSIPLNTYYGEKGEIEQKTSEWWEGLKKITTYWWRVLSIQPENIITITFSGQMEDVIPISDQTSFQNAILYSDTRAEAEALLIDKTYPDLVKETGNLIHSSSPLAKLLWLKNHDRTLYTASNFFVFSSKDFAIYKLTAAVVTDPTTAATTGMMNLSKRIWSSNILKQFAINIEQLPHIFNSDNIVGYVTDEAAAETGFKSSTPVLCGSGDAGASTIGAGAVNHGEAYFYLGTTGWAAIISDSAQYNQNIEGVFNLSHLPEDAIISIAPLLNAGNVHEWAVELYSNGKIEDNDNQYAAFDDLVKQSSAGSGGVLFLPYINGERSPVHDNHAKGAFWGINPSTKKNDMARAIIEGICFSYKQLVEGIILTKTSGEFTLIGGGAKSDVWCQTLSDILNRTVKVPVESEFMPALGAAASGFVQTGWVENYKAFSERFLTLLDTKYYYPNPKNIEIYEEKYQQYLKLYPNMRGIYS